MCREEYARYESPVPLRVKSGDKIEIFLSRAFPSQIVYLLPLKEGKEP
ncbi:MAG: hypothetical protein ABGX27_08755 [Desulfurobacteriaceae bacterium]